MRTPRRTWWGILFAAAAALTATAILFASRDPGAEAARHGAAGAPPRPATILTIKPSAHPRVIRPGFLGLSLEYSTIEPYAGSNPMAVNPVLVQLIRNLSPGQRPELRIGGDSTDWAWWPTRAVPRPRGIRIDLGPRWLRVTGALARALDARITLGINLEANRRKLAAAEARAFISGVGRSHIQALELGNEPELYASFGWYRTASGRKVPGRPRNWSFRSYPKDFSRIAAALPKVPLAGPAIGATAWMRHLGRFMTAEPLVRIVTLHRYPLQQCSRPAASSKSPSVRQLLSPAASRGLAGSVAPYVAAAHVHGDAVRIDELNSVSCGGTVGVSNAFASALWSVDALFEMARVGVGGVNIHTFHRATYGLFTFKRVNGAWTAFVAPEYYGLLMFAQSAPAGSRLMSVSGARGSLRAWATRGRDGRTRVALINADTGHARTVGVSAPGAAASLERLVSAGAHATSGVTLGGRSFGAQTSTGVLAGPSGITSVKPRGHEYFVRLPPASAALLTIPAH